MRVERRVVEVRVGDLAVVATLAMLQSFLCLGLGWQVMRLDARVSQTVRFVCRQLPHFT